MLFFFFFQAEDGIRDLTVTGVQTCALPISRTSRSGQRLVTCSAGNPPVQRTRAARRSSVARDRKSTRLNSSHSQISYAVFCLKKKKNDQARFKSRNDAPPFISREHCHLTAQ